MNEELKKDDLIRKVGGRFRLSSLIRQRLVALNNGSAPYVEVEKDTPYLDIVIKEIMEDKISLNVPGEEKNAAGSAPLF